MAEPERSSLQSHDPLVQIRLGDVVVNVICTGRGDIEFEAEGKDVVGLFTTYVHQHLLNRCCWTRSDALRLALRISAAFGGEVVDLHAVIAGIRRGWVRLLMANLMGDPAQGHGQRMHRFHVCSGLAVTIAAGSHHVLHTGGLIYGATFDLSDPEYLIVQPSNKKRWRARWERITKVSFAYFEPPDDWLSGVIAAQTKEAMRVKAEPKTGDVKP